MTEHTYDWIDAAGEPHTLVAAGEMEAAGRVWDFEHARTGSLALADAAAGTVERANPHDPIAALRAAADKFEATARRSREARS